MKQQAQRALGDVTGLHPRSMHVSVAVLSAVLCALCG